MLDKNSINGQADNEPDTGDSVSLSQPACLTTRYAERDDLAGVLDMYLAGLAEIEQSVLKPSVSKCAREVLVAWASAPCVLLEKAGKIIGFAGLKGNKAAYSDDPYLEEYMFYVKPAYRSVKAAKSLSDAVQKVAKTHKLPLFMSHMLSGHSVEHKAKFLKRWGYSVLSVLVKYEVK